MAENKAVESLPEVRAAIAALSPEDKELLAAVQDSPFKLTEAAQFCEFAANTDYFVLEPNIRDLNDLGLRFIAQHTNILYPPELLSAIDPVPFGQYAAKEEQGYFTEHGYISLSGDEWQHENPQSARRATESRRSASGWSRTKRNAPQNRTRRRKAKTSRNFKEVRKCRFMNTTKTIPLPRL